MGPGSGSQGGPLGFSTELIMNFMWIAPPLSVAELLASRTVLLAGIGEMAIEN